MNIGKIDLGTGGSGSGGLSSLAGDIPRLALLVLMALGAVGGGYYNAYMNRPHHVIQRSIDRTSERSFTASVEGAVSVRSFVLNVFRSRQSFSPGTGMAVTDMTEDNLITDETSHAPFDAVSALNALGTASDVVEHDRQDMYDHGARHFSGSLSPAGMSGDGKDYSFEYWCDMRTLLPVRLYITVSDPNAAMDSSGQPIPRQTTLNIRYIEWH